ncbi:unnamed protein product [Brachionus calyciflorus]|uniref:Uncharacterized protein n=1 Tax=Brachionus calyciflorus TaxID=104777 RepID=A0A814RTW4_9BILA|nr:unnamed protein product [Brachionus calyciflorus]
MKLEFDYIPKYLKNELIGEWAKTDPTITVHIKPNSTSKSVDPSDLRVAFSSSGQDLITVVISQQLEGQNNKIENLSKEIQNQTEEIKDRLEKLKILEGEKNLQPLLDFVFKFRLRIVRELVNNGVISECNDWNSMFNQLKQIYSYKKLWEKIVDKAYDLGLDYEDWAILKKKSSNYNTFQHSTTRLTKEEAFKIIETLKGTDCSNYYQPLKNLVEFFDRKNWQ